MAGSTSGTTAWIDVGSRTAAELSNLNEEDKARWKGFFGGRAEQREAKLKQWGLPATLRGGDRIFDAVLAAGIDIPFSIPHRVGFDVEQVRVWVAKRAQRLALEPSVVLEECGSGAEGEHRERECRMREEPEGKAAAGRPAKRRRKGSKGAPFRRF